jgi:hypothetical protein
MMNAENNITTVQVRFFQTGGLNSAPAIPRALSPFPS